MAMKLSSTLLNSGVGLQFLCRSPWRLQGGSCRTLFTAEALGIDQYLRQRNRVEIQFAGMADKFRAKMNEFTTSDSKNMIFTEDLKNILHLVDNRPEDMTLVYQMTKRFNHQNKHIRFGNFVFGPVVMRMYHHLNQPVQALEAFKDPELEGMFNNQTTGQILCDLLYANKMYNEVIEVFEIVNDKQHQGIKYPSNTTILAFAACAKLNNVESYEFVLKVLKDLQTLGLNPVRRTLTYAAQLALLQNAPQVALEILSLARRANYVTIRNLRMVAMADLNRPDDAFPILRSSIENDNPDDTRKQTVCPDVIKKIAESVERSGNKEFALEFERIHKGLKELNHISEQTLDELLNLDIEKLIRQDVGGQDMGFRNQTVGQSFRMGQSMNLRPSRNPAYDRERQSLRHEY